MTELKGLGSFDGKTHVLPISVYYEDTDLSGVVYHANYLRFMERGRTEFFRLAGISRADLEAEEPTAWTLRRVAVDYHRPARLDDQIAGASRSDRRLRRAAECAAEGHLRRCAAGGRADRSLHHHVNGKAAPHAQKRARDSCAFRHLGRNLAIRSAPNFGQSRAGNWQPASKGFQMTVKQSARRARCSSLAVALTLSAHAFAQQQAAPIAAPTGPAAQTGDLAPPPGVGAPAPAAPTRCGSFSIVSHVPARRHRGEGGDDPAAAGVAVVLDHHLQQAGDAGRPASARPRSSKSCSGPASRWTSSTSNSPSRNDHPMAAMFIAGLREWRRAFEGGAPRESQLAGIKDRIEKAMSVTILRETDGIEKQLGLLATIGSVSPFVGLFGTVWGIMNSFSAIAARHDTTLAVVAPGIAEALFATAMGLLAAIPAVIFYNRFVAEIGRYVNSLDAFADEFSAILSRQLDEKAR